ncbi:MAG TPA: PIN domain-containing protein [Acidimicrobiia bacterium]|nr:PIN domain-containing protein [Acidimicrobiia bacterium]
MIVVDTGVLYAVADRDDPDHIVSQKVLADRSAEPLLVPTTVITETAWLIESRLGTSAEAAFLRAIHQGELTRVDLTAEDWSRVIDLVEQYTDLGLGTVDASIVAVAERLEVDVIATLNRRDFAVVQPSHVPAFDLIP